MTTVPGTYFTKEQLEADLKVDNVSGVDHTDTNRMYQIGNAYYTEKKQYDKALAWYLLAARENSCDAQNNIGVLYYYGYAVPKNYLCALKWQLKSVEQNGDNKNHKNIGMFFEYGINVPLDKYKALEWYCHSKNKSFINKLKGQGFHRSASDKKKTLQQLIKETGAILNAEKRKLEAKHKTQQEIETLIDLNITYKLVDNGKDAWKDVPILLADDRQRYTKPVKSPVTDSADEILEQKKQIRLLSQDRSSFQSQGKQFQQETTKLELQMKGTDEELMPIKDDNQSLQRGNSTVQQQIARNDSNSVQNENTELKLKIISLEYQLKEKDNKINSLENENRIHRTSSVQQTQKLETLNHEKNTLEQLKASNNTLLQNKQDMSIEMERLKASNASLEQLLRSTEDSIMSLNGEDKNLSTANQFTIEMVETQKTLLQSKTNEMELLRQNMERQLVDEKKRVQVLEQENKALRQERVQEQTDVPNTNRLNNNSINHTNVGSSYVSDDDNAQNDINYDSEYDNTEESDNDEDNDINYDTPSEDEKT